MPVDQKLLLSHLSTNCFKAVEGAFAMAVRTRSKEVTIEHVILTLLDDAASELAMLVDVYQLDAKQVRSALTRACGAGTLPDKGRPALSPTLFLWLEEAWMMATLELGRLRIGSGILFLKLIQQGEKYGAGLADVPPEYVKQDLRTISVKAKETGAESRFTAAEVRALAESDAGGAGALDGVREFLSSLVERGSGLLLIVDQDNCVLHALGGAKPKVAAPAVQPAPAPVAAPPPAAADPEPAPPPAQAEPNDPAGSPSEASAESPPAPAETPAAKEPPGPPADMVPPPAPEPVLPTPPAPRAPSAPPPPAPKPVPVMAAPEPEEAPRSQAAPKGDATDTKALFRRLDKTCMGALERAAARAMRDKNYEISPEHFFYELLGDAEGTDMTEILTHFQLDRERMRDAVDAMIGGMRQGVGRPNFSAGLLEWLRDSDLSPTNPNGPKIRTGIVFFRFVQQTRKYTKMGTPPGLEVIPFEDLKKLLPAVLGRSREASEV